MSGIRNDVSVELIQHVGNDEMVARAARVSTGGDSMKSPPEGHGGLIRYLMKNRHGSPFEHGSMTFRVNAPIFVAREFMRHRAGWSYNEESGRYKVLDGEFYIPAPGRNLVQVGRPGHYQFEMGTLDQHAKMSARMENAYRRAWEAYEEMLLDGIAKEVARMVLPVGLFTSFYATCNPRSLMHFLSLRTHDELAAYPSQPMHEIEQVARGMEEHFKALYPLTHEAWDANGRVAP